ncbi:MAG: hypothetical protein K0Q63_3065 [Paenibacillus sp.]|nr:hypothetical protein [Paenibacillus sp.]
MLNIQLWPDNIVEALFVLIGLSLLIVIVIYNYRQEKAAKRPALWKALLIAFICVFSFTLNIPMGEYVGRFALLPLGVWVVYWATKNKSWTKYRRYAWIGFWCNYVFLATGLLGQYANEVVYPKHTIATYIANVEDARLVVIHPSAPEASLDAARLEQGITTLELQPEYDSLSWGYEAINTEKERFPYVLHGTESRWGSGVNPEVYVQWDGKGLLVVWDNRYLYYSAPTSLLLMDSGGGNE